MKADLSLLHVYYLYQIHRLKMSRYSINSKFSFFISKLLVIKVVLFILE